MQVPSWMRTSQKNRRRADSSADRRRRDELLIPLEVGKLEERRVLSGSPTLAITGAGATSAFTSQTTKPTPFSSVTLSDSDTTENVTVTITQQKSDGTTDTSKANGSLSGTGLVDNGSGVYTISGVNAAQATTDINALQFTPTAGTPGGTVTTMFKISLGDGAGGATTVLDDNTTLNETTPDNILISSTQTATASLFDDQTIQPFQNGSGVVAIGDSDSSDLLTVTVTQDLSNNSTDTTLKNGALAGTGFTESNGVYTLTGVNAATATTDLQSLVFTPTVGKTASTIFKLSVTDSAPNNTAAYSTTDSVTKNVPPVLSKAGDFSSIAAGATDPSGIEAQNLVTASDSEGNPIGIAVTSVDDTLGNWQYSSDDASTWTNIPAASSATSAFLLAPSDQVRFLPNAGYGGTASITFLAWDTTAGTVDQAFDTTQSPGSEAFSTASGTTTIPVVPTLAISGTGTTHAAPAQTPAPFSGVTITDTASNNDTITVTITQQFGNGADNGDTDLHDANATLSLAGANSADLVNNNNGTYTLTGSVSQVLSDLQQLTFTPTSPAVGNSKTTKFALDVSDTLGATEASDDSTKVVVTNPPTLTGSNGFAAIQTDGSPTAMSVSLLISGDTDPAGIGIGITSVDDANGTWKYFNTTTNLWTAIPAKSSGHAFLLSGGDQVEFVPNTGFAGTSSITFLAWDENVGSDQTNFTLSGSPNDFSANTESSTISVVPVLSILGTTTTTVPAGATPSPFSTATIGDNTTNSDPVTLTITLSNSANGTLAGSGLTGGAGGIYTITGSATQVQSDLAALVFTPATSSVGTSVTTTFALSLSDTLGAATVTDNGTVVIVNTPPTLTSAINFSSIPAETASAAIQVSRLIDANSSSDGVAVIAADDSNGVWQYSTNGTTGWATISPSGAPVSSTNAFLLNASDYIRFDSTAGGPTTATITLLAWAPTNGGVAHSYVNPASLPGAFSNTAAQSSITVYPALSIGGTGTTVTQDNVNTDLFNSGGPVHATIGDTDPTDMLTISITQELPSGGGTDATLLDGSLSSGDNFSGFVNNGNGTYTLTVAAANATSELDQLVFTPSQGPPGATVDTTFQLQVADATAPTVTDSGTIVDVTSVAPPALTGTKDLPPIPEGASTNTNDPGIQVSSLPLGAGPSSGIAISAMDSSNGTWEYSTDSGADWTDITAMNGLMGSPPQVFLLSATDFIRFVPTAGSNFTGTASITYQAWSGVGRLPDQITNPAAVPFNRNLSMNTETAQVVVYPVLAIGGTATSSSLDDQTSAPFGSATIGDTLATENVTVTITQQQLNGVVATTDSTLANGSLSGAGLTNNNNGTYALTGTAAQVTSALQALVFAPTLHEVADGQKVVTQFQIVVADANFAPINTVTNSITQLTVTANAAPVLPAGANNLPSIAENVASAGDSGRSVSNLLLNKATDADGNPIGIAVFQTDSSNGEWDYSTDGGASWTAITGVSSTSALLLAPSDLVRFLPNANFFGTATIQFLAWDGTVGLATQTIDPTMVPGSGAFSSLTATSTIQVVAPASIFASAPTVMTNDETAVTVFAAAFGTPIPGSPAPGITDPNTPAQTYTVTVAIGTPANGTFTNATNANGWTSLGSGEYQFTGTAAAANLALQNLSFLPTAHQVQPGTSKTTGFTITVNDGITTPTSLDTIAVIATAVNDPPTFVVLGSTSTSLAVLAPNGTKVDTARATDVDANSDVTYSITGGNAAGAYAIDASGNITVANNAALSYSSTPTVLTITAENIGANNVPSAPAVSTRTIYLWAVTASATPIAADSSTTLTLSLQYSTSPPAPPLTVGPLTVAWDDGITNTATLSSTAPTASLVHFYATNPNKTDPAAAIPISVTGANVSLQTSALVSGTGIGIAIIPDAQSSFVELVAAPALEAAPALATPDQPVTQSVDVGVAENQTTTDTDRRVVLRIISPQADEGSATKAQDKYIVIPEAKVKDLPSLFKKLPDGHYQVLLNGRLMIDVMVRQGRPVNSSDDSGGADDRPPTSQSESDKSAGLTDADPSAPQGPAATALEKQPASGSGQPATGGNHQNAPPTGPSPGATQTPPAPIPVSNPAAGRGTPTAAMQPFGLADRGVSPAPTKHEKSASLWSEKWATWAAGVAAAATVAANPERADDFMEKLSKRSLTKAARLSRSLRKRPNVE
jgi:hypothetical protein